MAVEFKRGTKHEGHSTGFIKFYGVFNQGIPETIWANDGFKGFLHNVPLCLTGWKCDDPGAVGFVEKGLIDAINPTHFAGQRFTFNAAGTFNLILPFTIPSDFDAFYIGVIRVQYGGPPTSIKAYMYSTGIADASNGASLKGAGSPAQTTWTPTSSYSANSLAYVKIEVVAAAAADYVEVNSIRLQYINTFGNVPFF